MHSLTVVCVIVLACLSLSSGRGIVRISAPKISISKPVVVPSRPVVVPSRPVVVPSRPVVVPSRPVVVPSRPVVVPSRPVIVVPPPARPVVVIRPAPSRPVITIIRRPRTYVPVFYPVYHPMPVSMLVIHTTVHTTTNSNQAPSPTFVQTDCNNGHETIFERCQGEVATRYPPDTLNTTRKSCCSTYAETACYVNNAAQYCSATLAKALIEHSQAVAKYFEASICQTVSYSTWDTSCALTDQVAEQKIYTNANTKPAFIELPVGNGNENVCLGKLRTAKEGGDLTKQCLDASLNAWDPDRNKMVTSLVSDTCCAMYDSLECLVSQANGICSTAEIADLVNYKVTSTDAFSQGVCRAVPYKNVSQICRGDYHSPSSSFAVVPSITLTLMALYLITSM